MRWALVGIALLVAGPAVADNLPTKDCSAAFLAQWRSDPDKALKNMPKDACWMRTQTGPYVCYKDGCSRAAAYFDGQ